MFSAERAFIGLETWNKNLMNTFRPLPVYPRQVFKARIVGFTADFVITF